MIENNLQGIEFKDIENRAEDLTGDEPIRDYREIIVVYHYTKYICTYCGWLYNSSHIVYKVKRYHPLHDTLLFSVNIKNDFYCMGSTKDFYDFVIKNDLIRK